jgi:hypothetical protein
VKPIATIYRTTDDQYFVVEIEGPSGFQRPPYSFVSSYAYEIETFVRRSRNERRTRTTHTRERLEVSTPPATERRSHKSFLACQRTLR